MHYGFYPKDKTIVLCTMIRKSMWDYQQSVKGQAVMGLLQSGYYPCAVTQSISGLACGLFTKDYETDGRYFMSTCTR
jgi:hypothetical protein